MANGEGVVSQAQSEAFDAGWDRMEHRDDGSRGRFVWDPVAGRLVRPEDREEAHAVNASVMVGRFHENTRTVDGVDISTRAKRKRYMREHNLADPSDFTEHIAKKRAERDRFYRTGYATPADEQRAKEATREIVTRVVEQRQRDYDRERHPRERERHNRGKGFEF